MTVYTPHVWLDNVEGGTPITATKLNEIEAGLVTVGQAVGQIAGVSATVISLPAATNSNALRWVTAANALYLDTGTWIPIPLPQRVARNIAATVSRNIDPAADVGNMIFVTSAAVVNLTVVADTLNVWPLGQQVEIVQLGAGQVVVVQGASTVVVGANGLKTRVQNSVIKITRITATDNYNVSGDTVV